jgi:hypothetical protein
MNFIFGTFTSDSRAVAMIRDRIRIAYKNFMAHIRSQNNLHIRSGLEKLEPSTYLLTAKITLRSLGRF